MSDLAETGWWRAGETPPLFEADALPHALRQVSRPVALLDVDGRTAVGLGGTFSQLPATGACLPVRAWVPALHPRLLGDPIFKERYGLRYAYVVGAMANGITSVEMVRAAGRAGLLAFFGAAGLSPAQIEAALDRLQAESAAETFPFGVNLIHSPNEPDLEAATVALYLRRGIRLVSASAYLDMTTPLIHFRVKGIHRAPDGRVVCPNRVVAKVSREEIARKFFAPPPAKHLERLRAAGLITAEEAELATAIPVAEDLSAEADSGGHTDNQPALALLPTMLAVRDQALARYRYPSALCVGLGGGIATPESAAAAFAMGAAYVLTGSINQACVEAGTSPTVRRMLSEARQADVTMAPAADMFELGVKVQVLKRGTMFALRAARLYELYRRTASLEALSSEERGMLERDFFRCPLESAWEQTRAFFETRDPSQIERAEADPRHKLALVFRSYLGRASGWANAGDPSRVLDYQVWCGPAMGAFNAWVQGSCLEATENRRVAAVARNLLVGASVATRLNWLRCQGVALPPQAAHIPPLTPEQLEACLQENHQR